MAIFQKYWKIYGTGLSWGCLAVAAVSLLQAISKGGVRRPQGSAALCCRVSLVLGADAGAGAGVSDPLTAKAQELCRLVRAAQLAGAQVNGSCPGELIDHFCGTGATVPGFLPFAMAEPVSPAERALLAERLVVSP